MTSFAYDLAGKIVPRGKVESTYIDHAFGRTAALPAGLEVSSGTATYGLTSASRGYLQVASGAVSGNAGTLRTVETYDQASVYAILWEAHGLVYDSSTIQMTMGLANSASVGCFVKQDSSDATLFVAMAGNSTAVPYNIRTSSEATRRRNLAMLLIPATKTAYVLEDDQVMAKRTHTSLNLGAVKPEIGVTTREAVAHNFQVSRVRLTTWHD